MSNIILITIDCLRPDHLNCYGYKRLTSPFLDSLAGKGLMFTNMYSNSSYTCASVASMITGTYPFDYGEYLEFSTPAKLSKRRILLSEVLKTHGYSTALFHDNPYLSPIFGYDRGFDLVVDFGEKQSSSAVKRPVFSIFRNEKIRRMIWRTKDLLSFWRWYSQDIPLNTDSDAVFMEAYNWIENATPPYFLWMHLMDTHVPYCSKHETLSKFGVSKLDALRVVYKHFRGRKLTSKDFKVFKLLYDAQIYQVDNAMSKYLPKIMTKNASTSYVVVTADHGEAMEDKEKIGHTDKLTDELLHVPLIIYGEGLEPKIIDMKASLIDLAPTILDFLGIDEPKSYRGQSLLRKCKPDQVIAQGIFKGKIYQRTF
jgi:arylsulfatase